MPMNPAVKEMWLTALRSGKYTQGLHTLKLITTEGTPRHCCLGVLGDVAVVVGITTERQRECGCDIPEHSKRTTYGGSSSAGLLPSTVCKWAGLSDHVQGELASMNDSGHSFAEIADWIEANL